MKRNWRSLAESGDTIVEVLIVLAIVGLALSISYATANKSLLGVRQAEEHAQALQLVQGQIEQLRGFTAAGLTTASGIPPSTSNPATCLANGLVTADASSCGPAGNDNLYTISLSGTYPDYEVQANWPDVIGSGTDNVSLNYRFYGN